MSKKASNPGPPKGVRPTPPPGPPRVGMSGDGPVLKWEKIAPMFWRAQTRGWSVDVIYREGWGWLWTVDSKTIGACRKLGQPHKTANAAKRAARRQLGKQLRRG